MAKSAKIQSPKKELKNQVITHLHSAIEYLRAHLSEKEFKPDRKNRQIIDRRY